MRPILVTPRDVEVFVDAFNALETEGRVVVHESGAVSPDASVRDRAALLDALLAHDGWTVVGVSEGEGRRRPSGAESDGRRRP